MRSRKFEIFNSNGWPLKGTIYEPTESIRAAIIINPAIAASERMYQNFAQHLTKNGYAAITWNYSGTPDSCPTRLAEFNESLTSYGLDDMAAIVEYARSVFGSYDLIGVGHSIGGQLIGMIPNNCLYKGFIGVGVSSGCIYLAKAGCLLKSFLYFTVIAPLSLMAFRYVPNRRYGLGTDIPKTVFLEWKSWCLSRRYLFDHRLEQPDGALGNYKDLPFPMTLINALDDEIATPRNIEHFRGEIQSSYQIRCISVPSSNRSKIGHMGYFRKTNRDTTWKAICEAVDWHLNLP